nr:hypothetical protein [Tanacetum cinerariifolium]
MRVTIIADTISYKKHLRGAKLMILRLNVMGAWKMLNKLALTGANMALHRITRHAGSESRPPMLNKESYVPWLSRLLCYAKSRQNGKLIHNSIINGPYVRQMIPELGDTNREVPVTETFHVQIDDELTRKELKHIEADDQVIQTILLSLPEDIYAAVDSYEIAQEIWLRVQQMMKGSDIRIQEKKAKLFNEWESNLKFLNNLQPKWSRHVTIIHQTKDLHAVDYTQLYDFLKFIQKEVDELKVELLAKIQDPLALMENFNTPYAFITLHQDQPLFNQNYVQQLMPNPEYIIDPTTTMNMALGLMAKAFNLNYSTPTRGFHQTYTTGRLHNRNIRNQNRFIGVPGNTTQNLNRNGTQTDKAPVNDSDGLAEVHDYENCDDNEIFNMFTQEEQYTELLEPIPDQHQVPQNHNNVIFKNLAIEVEKVNLVNRKLKETDANLTIELARFKNQEKCFEISQEKYDKHERCYQQSVYQEQCLSKKINALHLSSSKQIMTLNEGISDLNKKLLKEKSTVSFLLGEKKRMTLETHNWSSSAHQELHKIVKDENFPIVNQVDARVQNFEIQFLKEAAKFVGNFKSLAKEADASLAKHKALELKIKRLLRAVVSQDIISVMQKESVVDTSDLQTELERTKECFENCIIKKENEYAKLWNDWISPFKTSREESRMPNITKASNRMKTITISQPSVFTKKDVNSDSNGLSPTRVDNTKTRRPHPRSNTKNVRVLSASKSSQKKNKEAEVEEHYRNLLLSKNNKHMSLAWQFCDSDLEVAFRRNACFIKNLDGVDLLKGDCSKNLYTINLHEMASASPIYLMACTSSTKLWLWHQRLSHLNFDTINDLARNDLVLGLLKFKYHNEHLYPLCEQGKSKRESHPPKPISNSRQRLHLIHMDLCGPMRIASINGKQYVLSPVIIIRSDNGSKFKNHVLKEYFDCVGISHQVSSVRTPQQNGVVERRNWTLVEAARTMLIFSHAPLFLWAEAIATAALCYPKNDREDIGKRGTKETMNVSFDEISSMAFEQCNSKLELQSEFDLLFEAMYDDYIGGQPSTTVRTVLEAHEPQVRQTSTKSTSIADTAPTPTNSFSHVTNFPNTLQDVDELNPNAMVDGDTFVNPFANPSTKDVYLCQPEGFIDADHPSHVYKLKKALYGLKEAPRAWYDELSTFLLENHFFKGTIDSTLLKRRFYDDILVTPSKVLPVEFNSKEKSLLVGPQRSKTLTDYGFYFNKIPIYCDSKSAISISCNPVQHSRTKHIAARYHFIKEHVEKGTIELYFVKTDYQLADIFTKALPADCFNYLVLRLGMRSLSLQELNRLAKSQ